MNRPNDPPDDLGYEVVEDPGYEVVDAPPPAPKPRPAPPPSVRAPNPAYPPAKPLPPAQPAKRLPAAPRPGSRVAAAPAADEGPGFEVVGAPPKPKKPKVQVVDDEEDEEALKDTQEVRRTKSKTVRARGVDEDEEDDDRDRDDEDDRPRKKRKKRRKGARARDGEEKESPLNEWIVPGFLMFVGVVMLAVGTGGQAKGVGAEVNTAIFIVLRLVFECFIIPISIVALMVIGSVFGIEYGTLGQAVRGLAAVSLLVDGLGAICQWGGVPFFMYQPVLTLVLIGMFMTLFKLEIWETIVTVFCLKVILFLLGLAAVILMILMLAHGAKHRDDDFKAPRDQPGQSAPAEFGDPGDNDPDDPPPPPRQGGGRGKGFGRQRPNTPPPGGFPGDD